MRLRCELVGINTEAHITIVNFEQTKSIFKSIERIELAKRIKLSSETDFFPVKIKLFHREEEGDYMLGIERKSLAWGHGIAFPEDLKELMTMLEIGSDAAMTTSSAIKSIDIPSSAASVVYGCTISS